MKQTTLLLAFLFCCLSVFAQPKFKQVKHENGVTTLDATDIETSFIDRKDTMSIDLPINGKSHKLKLDKYNYKKPIITVKDNGGERLIDTIADVVMYKGTVKGSKKSLVVLMITRDEVSGIILDEDKTYDLGKLKGQNKHAIAERHNEDNPIPIECGTRTDTIKSINIQRMPIIEEVTCGNRVPRIYVEAGFKTFTDFGSNLTNAVNWLTLLTNQWVILYARDNITITINQITVWTTSDPYAAMTTSSQILSAFRTTNAPLPVTKGDEAMFVDTRSLGGGVAYVRTLCSGPNGSNYNFSCCQISSYYNDVPVYSWSVQAPVHELGHSFSSPHTHDCIWGGVGLAIDSCGPLAGYGPGYPSTGCRILPGYIALPYGIGGTIMSYCHLCGGIGINLNNGFGPLPKQAIQSYIAGATCLAYVAATPTNLISSGITSNSAVVSWASSNPPYTVQYRFVGTNTWQSVTSTTNSTTITSLDAGTIYNWRVAAACTDYSAEAQFTTKAATTCVAPMDTVKNDTCGAAYTGHITTTITHICVNNVVVRNVTTTDNCSPIQVQCTAPTGFKAYAYLLHKIEVEWLQFAGITYRIAYRKVGITQWSSKTGKNSGFILRSLNSGATYEVKVGMKCPDGTFKYTTSIFVTVK